ncbi:MAG: hypothetical protein ACOC6B_00945 [Thermodesulfobacteriota bacterium]
MAWQFIVLVLVEQTSNQAMLSGHKSWGIREENAIVGNDGWSILGLPVLVNTNRWRAPI